MRFKLSHIILAVVLLGECWAFNVRASEQCAVELGLSQTEIARLQKPMLPRVKEVENDIINLEIAKKFPLLGLRIRLALRSVSTETSLNFHTVDHRTYNVKVHQKKIVTLSDSRESHPALNWGFDSGLEFPNDQTRSAVREVYNMFNDRVEISIYLVHLMQEVAEYMQERGMTDSLAQGKLEFSAVVAVLVKKFEKRKMPVHSINEFVVSSQEFFDKIEQGPFIDAIFLREDDFSHGAISHLIQFDYINPIIQKYFKENPIEFYHYLASPQGQPFWINVFDSEGTPYSPEGFSWRLHEFLPMFPKMIEEKQSSKVVR